MLDKWNRVLQRRTVSDEVQATPAPVDKRKRGTAKGSILAGSRVFAVERRLERNLLSDQDKEQLEQTGKVRKLMKTGASTREVARALGMHEYALTRLLAAPIFNVYNKHLEEVEKGDNQKIVDRIVRQAKSDFAQFAPDAIAFIRGCFARTTDGKWLDKADAQWATQLVAKGLGLTEPETAVRPIIHIQTAAIRIETEQVREDDEEARRALKARDVTPAAQIVSDEENS